MERLLPATLFYRAVDFAAAADAYAAAYGTRTDGYMITFLLGRALELSIKASLLANGVTATQLRSRRYGHNLESLLKASEERGLTIIDTKIPDARWGIQKLNEAYCSKELEYQERGTYSSPTPQLLRKLVHFALYRTSFFALRPDVRDRLLKRDPPCPGLAPTSSDLY